MAFRERELAPPFSLEGFKEDPVGALIDEEIGGCDCGDDTGGAEAAFLLPFLMLGGLRRRHP
jgi:hypothetical protein